MSKIILGVTGGISAYKACDIISGLRATGHEVRVMMTESAKRFITEETLAVISGNPVYTDQNRDLHGRVSHIDLAKWGGALIIAPATANTLSKINNLYCDNFLTTVIMAYDGPNMVLAPAMNPRMLAKMEPVIKSLSEEWLIIDSVFGKMACGDTGQGKLAKPRAIVESVNNYLV